MEIMLNISRLVFKGSTSEQTHYLSHSLTHTPKGRKERTHMLQKHKCFQELHVSLRRNRTKFENEEMLTEKTNCFDVKDDVRFVTFLQRLKRRQNFAVMIKRFK